MVESHAQQHLIDEDQDEDLAPKCSWVQTRLRVLRGVCLLPSVSPVINNYKKIFKSKIKQLLNLTEDIKSHIRNRNNQEIFNHYFANLIETDDNDLIANLVHLFKEKKLKTIKELIDNKEPLIYLLELLKMSIDNNLRSTTLRITRDGDIFTVNIDPIL